MSGGDDGSAFADELARLRSLGDISPVDAFEVAPSICGGRLTGGNDARLYVRLHARNAGRDRDGQVFAVAQRLAVLTYGGQVDDELIDRLVAASVENGPSGQLQRAIGRDFKLRRFRMTLRLVGQLAQCTGKRKRLAFDRAAA